MAFLIVQDISLIKYESSQLLVYDDGQVIPSSLQTIKPNLEYSVVVSLSTDIQYGRVILAMDKGFCTDNAGNHFIRPQNSSLVVHFGEHMNQITFCFLFVITLVSTLN